LLKLKTPPQKIVVANNNPEPGVPAWLSGYPIGVVDYAGNLDPAKAAQLGQRAGEMKLAFADSGQFSLRRLPVLGLFMSHDAVQKRLSANEAFQILQEVTNQRFGFANVSSCHMRGNEAIWFHPKRVIVWQRLRFGHVQPGGLEVS
jgi:hypothetical protein